jgi:uncharacterized membrane protein (UPF0182 family)
MGYAIPLYSRSRVVSLRRVLLGLLAILILTASGVGYYTEWLWFESLGYPQVFLTMLLTGLALFLLGSFAFSTLLWLNLAIARRQARLDFQSIYGVGPLRGSAFLDEPLTDGDSTARQLSAVMPLAVGLCTLVLGIAAAGNWLPVLRFVHQRYFGVNDPLFGRDVAFYVFSLPLVRFLEGWLIAALALVTMGTLAVYVVMLRGVPILGRDWLLGRGWWGVKRHLLGLLSCFLIILAVHHLLDLVELVHSTRTVTYGAGHADVYAQIPAQWLVFGLALTATVLILASMVRRSLRPVLVGLVVWAMAAVLIGGLYPTLVQIFQVRPNELARQRPFIERNITATLRAYGLDDVEEKLFPAEEVVTPADVRANPETISNLRLWDPRALLPTYNQLQSIRLYYEFSDVDVDRYWVNGEYRQITLGVRELVQSKLPAQARTWVNQKLMFTHGFGATANPVNAVGPEGQPVFFAQDVPPVGDIPIQRPEVYFGERDRPNDYVVVGTATPEFDYPLGDHNAQTAFHGSGGVELSSTWRRLLYAWQFHDLNLLLNTDMQPESRLLYRRNVRDRVSAIAPFLHLDSDPYIVITEGRLVWVLDAYTLTSGYPYAQPHSGTLFGQEFNYIRNSVQVTVDAYDGRTTFYMVDPTDSLVQTYASIFPDMFVPIDTMPEDLRRHLRYPEDLFTIQAEMYLTYHMQDPTVFYNREDLWSVPFERFGDERERVQPYYTIMRLPNERDAEFLLMLPMAPANRDNMIAWLAGRSDGKHYGKLLVYKYPKDKLIYGPLQVETRIDQDPVISAQFSLWNQRGSRVIRGNLLVIPVGNSNLYLEPVYLQAEQSPLPELQRIVLATGNRIAMEPTLSGALARLFGADSIAARTPELPDDSLGSTALSAEAAAMTRAVREHLNQAREAQRADDWARYGVELRALEEALRALEKLAE